MTDYSEFVELAQELIRDAGREVTFNSAATADPEKPWTTGATATPKNAIACFLPASGSNFGYQLVTDEMLSRVTQVVLVAPDGTDYESTKSITDSGKTYGVEWITKLQPGTVVVLWAMGVKQ